MIKSTKRKLAAIAGIAAMLILSACSQESTESVTVEMDDMAETSSDSQTRPNFIIFTTDDMGYTDLGAFGGKDIPTPNIDEIALQGVRLTNFHVSTSCSPTRSMLMSGTGNHEAGVGTQNANAHAPEHVGLPGYEGIITDRVLNRKSRSGSRQTKSQSGAGVSRAARLRGAYNGACLNPAGTYAGWWLSDLYVWQMAPGF